MASKEVLRSIHKELMEQFDIAFSDESEVRSLCLRDRRLCFVAGAWWEDNLGNGFENRPKYEINKVAKSVQRAIIQHMNNRVTANFRPGDDVAAEDDISEVLDGLHRADEIDSNAAEAFDNAYIEGVSGGIGAWRLAEEYEDEDDDDNDRQRIIFKPIYDADSTVWFFGGEKKDKSDATGCLLLRRVSKSWHENEYTYNLDEDSYTGSEVDPIKPVVRKSGFEWMGADVVYIGEYYRVEEKKEYLQIWLNPLTQEEEKIIDPPDEKIKELEAGGLIKIREKRVKRRAIHKYIVDGSRVLEDLGYIAGEYIPVIMFYGERYIIDGVEQVNGKVRNSVDAQRLYNAEISMLADTAIFSQREKPIVWPEQMTGGIAEMWASDNVENNAYLYIKPAIGPNNEVVAAGPVGTTKPGAISPATAAIIEIANRDIQDIMGSDPAQDQIKANVSAEAVELTQNRVDMDNHGYQDNFACAMRHSAKVWLSKAKEVYSDDGRKMRIVKQDGAQDYIELGSAEKTDKGIELKNVIKKGKYSVIADVGPSFMSQRDANVRSLINLATAAPDNDMKTAFIGLALQNMEGAGLNDAKEFVRKRLVGLGVIEPTEEEKAAAAEQGAAQPSSQDLYLQAEAEKSRAQAVEAQAKTGKSIAEAQKTSAETAQILSTLQQDEQKHAIEVANAMANALQNRSSMTGPMSL